MRRVLWIFLLALPAFGQFDASDSGVHAGQTFHDLISVKFRLEDGARILSTPAVIVMPPSRCSTVGVFYKGSTGVIRLDDPAHIQRWTEPMSASTCSIRLVLPGYRILTVNATDGQELVLSRQGDHEGSLVSMSTLKAPPEAQDEYGTGEALMAKRKWAEAEPHFRRATSIYPAYAPAWSELAKSLQEQGRFDDAEQALRKAMTADPKYLKPVLQMAELDERRQQWDSELREGQKALDLRVENKAAAQYYVAEADYHLLHMTEAEEQCRKSIASDADHELPQAHFLLGNILSKEGKPADAIAEYRAYEKADRKGPFAKEAKDRVQELKAER